MKIFEITSKYKFIRPGQLRGSYTDQQLTQLGFKKSPNGGWYIETYKWDNLVKSGKLYEGASGYIPSEKEKNDPRFKTSLTVDVKPDTIKTNAKKLSLGNIKRSGIPNIAKTNGLI
jgi:hypothetical protein